MALLQVNFISTTLKRTVPMQVILPVDKMTMEGTMEEEKGPYKTLYLLHGLLGNDTDWVSGTRIQRWAEEKNLAVVMPSGDNAFYIDQQLPGNNYGEYIGRELVEITRRMFPLSRKKEDTFIGGLSMGGFGALRNGFKYYDTFGYIAGLSSALYTFEINIDEIKSKTLDKCLCFGKLEEAVKTDKNPRVVVEKLKEARERDESITIPKVYMACGLQDSLLEVNRSFRDFLVKNDVDVTYEEGQGNHDWDFWDTYIKKVLDWLPLDQKENSMNSGNVIKM